ncbi:RNA polymerase II degradation factor 1 [Nakaseomyces glabratus]|nr:RNA polymerase II degradation factor 1 [Nakaseomyces glabratus]KTB23725.1 RNA polymerase II degradation factor 1 [Nakaseomyces glabratus]
MSSVQNKVETLVELFPNWKREDLLELVQEEKDTELEIIVEKITTGKVTKWDEVKKPKRERHAPEASSVRTYSSSTHSHSAASGGAAAPRYKKSGRFAGNSGVSNTATGSSTSTSSGTSTSASSHGAAQSASSGKNATAAAQAAVKKTGVPAGTKEEKIAQRLNSTHTQEERKKMSWAAIATPKPKPKPVQKKKEEEPAQESQEDTKASESSKESALENVEDLKNEVDNIEKEQEKKEEPAQETEKETVEKEQEPQPQPQEQEQPQEQPQEQAANEQQQQEQQQPQQPQQEQQLAQEAAAPAEAAPASKQGSYQQPTPMGGHPAMVNAQFSMQQGYMNAGTPVSAGVDLNTATAAPNTAQSPVAPHTQQQSQQQPYGAGSFMPYYAHFYQQYPYGQPQYGDS